MIKLGRYQVCILDLVTESRTGKLSVSKIWRHICYAILSKTMLTVPEVTWDLMVAYGGIVGSSEAAIMLIKYKYGGKDADSDSK